jgi:hypothetical protein
MQEALQRPARHQLIVTTLETFQALPAGVGQKLALGSR